MKNLKFLILLAGVVLLCLTSVAFASETIFEDDFSTDKGWTYGTSWERGSATASTGHTEGYPDPANDHTATEDNFIIGSAIGGNIGYNEGDHGYYWVTSPTIDCSDSGTYLLSFWRWLNLHGFGSHCGKVDVWDGEQWRNVWNNEGGSQPVHENSWNYREYDVTSYINSNFQIRFGHRKSNSEYSHDILSGWNIDDIKLKRIPFGSTTPWKRINTGARSVPRYLFDVDDDGHVDSITQGFWYKNPGDGIGSWTSYSIGNDDYPGSGCARTGDIDGDGLPDLVIGVGRSYPAPDRNRIYAFINPGTTGTWTRYHIGTLSPDKHDGVETVAIGDLNNDGYPDILAGGECKKLMAFINPGYMTDNWGDYKIYETEWVCGTPADIEGMVVKDFDNDGWLDVAATCCHPLGCCGETIVLTNPTDGSGNWDKITLTTAHYSCVESIAAGDVDGDGWVDVVLAPYAGQQLYWYKNPQGAGAWAEYSIDGSGYSSPKVADIDMDGKSDIIWYNGTNTYWYTKDGIDWVRNKICAARITGIYAAVGDVDRDYDWDIIYGDYWYINPTKLLAWNPNPVGVSVPNDVVLSWSPGEGAESHDVYFGTDYNEVANAGLSSRPAGDVDSNGQVNFADVLVLVEQWLDNPEGLEPSANLNDDNIVNLIDFAIMADDWMGCGVFRGNQDTNTYDTNRCDPCGLELDVTYYWRIDEVKGADTLKGKVWEFTTRSDPDIYLVAHYDFETGSGTTVYDQAANPADGTLNGDPQWAAGKIGDWALNLDGDGDFVTCGHPDKFDITDAITVMAWVKISDWDKSWQTIISRYSSWSMRRDTAASCYGLPRHDAFGFFTVGTGQPRETFATTPLDDGQWHHVAATYDGATGKQCVYTDGTPPEETSQGTVAGQITVDPDCIFTIGAQNETGNVSFKGLIDDVRIYSRALLKEEIEKLMHEGDD